MDAQIVTVKADPGWFMVVEDDVLPVVAWEYNSDETQYSWALCVEPTGGLRSVPPDAAGFIWHQRYSPALPDDDWTVQRLPGAIAPQGDRQLIPVLVDET